MNPRRRRLLFPALLVVLLVVAAVVSLARDADARPLGPSSLGTLSAPATLSRVDDETAVAARVVSTVRDPRITESSGLAVSAVHDDLAYTITKTICEQTDVLQSVHKALSGFSCKEAWKPENNVIPLHPGAVRYYKEAGYM